VFNVAEEHTRGVGTSIYTSPELENEGHYDEKVGQNTDPLQHAPKP